ncbi:10222_t:CDS:10 [Cetraspora pellucida]|uniref:10222_t:CDS:1 n=1 Tax=Cetraspora pellucida TaxID=1433469 RepID=A0ACA9KLK7_9GLOM|nr:10222_t:CDS:10 [Cetraspora pellucida]
MPNIVLTIVPCSHSPPTSFAIVLSNGIVARETNHETHNFLSGIIAIINGTSNVPQRPSIFSPDEKCPNCQYGLYRDETDQYQWNPNGQGLIQERFDFPIFAVYPINGRAIFSYNLIMEGAANNLRKSFNQYPLRAVELSSFMWSAIDASTCLRRGIRALFHTLTLGVDNGVSGTVALLAVADAISRSQVAFDNLPKHILYTLFDGEAWGFAGSSRFVADITQFNCQIKGSAKGCPFKGGCGFPCKQDLDFTRINFTNIESIFEFSQVGMNTKGFYVHVDSNSTVNVDLINKMNNISATINNGSAFVQAASANGINNKLPPSSSMAFLEKNRSLAAVVLGDFQYNLTNEYDDAFNVPDDSIVDSICSIANVTAQTVWLQAQGPNYSNISISYGQPGFMPTLAYNYLLALNSSLASCKVPTDCQNGESCYMSRCTKTLTRYHDAYGAGLQYNQDGKLFVTDPTKATWVEST